MKLNNLEEGGYYVSYATSTKLNCGHLNARETVWKRGFLVIPVESV